MKKFCLLFVLCAFSVLAFAQADSYDDAANQSQSLAASSGWATLSPMQWSLGTVPARYGFYQGFTVSNGSGNNISISRVALTNSPTFLIVSPSCVGTLPTQTTCLITVQFFATDTASPSSATLTVTTNVGSLQATIKGTVVKGDATLSVLDCQGVPQLYFPCRVVMWDGPVLVTLTNNQGSSSLTINSIVAAPSPLFSILPASTCPVKGGTLPAHGSCTIDVDYTGSFQDWVTGTLSVIDDSP